jgi:hypothetical protein
MLTYTGTVDSLLSYSSHRRLSCRFHWHKFWENLQNLTPLHYKFPFRKTFLAGFRVCETLRFIRTCTSSNFALRARNACILQQDKTVFTTVWHTLLHFFYDNGLIHISTVIIVKIIRMWYAFVQLWLLTTIYTTSFAWFARPSLYLHWPCFRSEINSNNLHNLRICGP